LTLSEKVLPDDWGRNLVWRYRVQKALPDFPATLIVKVSKLGGGHIFNEWASLQFLNRFESLGTLVPTFYGGDAAYELLVLEDLGAFRHIFLSTAYFRISHLSCLNGSLIPLELQAEAEATYFQTLAPLLPDPAAYQVDYAAAATAMVIWILSLYLEKKDRPRHLATLRQRMFAALTLYTQHHIFTAPFPHTAAALTRLQQKLDVQWTEAEKRILPFPAFESTARRQCRKFPH